MSDFYSMLVAAEKRPHADRERVQLQALTRKLNTRNKQALRLRKY